MTDISSLQACLHPPLEVSSHRYDYLGEGKVMVSLTTKSGETIRYVMSTLVFMDSMNLANDCMNANLGPVLRDIRIF
jgi:hypothetical protein